MRAGPISRWVRAIALLLSAGTAVTAVTKVPPQHPYRREYKKNTFGKKAIAPVVGGAAIRRGAGGFGKRLGTSFGTHVAKNSVQYGVAGLRHEDLHYRRSTRKKFGPRLKHALVGTVVTRKTTTGRKTVASGRLSGAATAGLLAGGAASGGITLGADAGANVAREFWPRHHRRKYAAKQ